MAEIKVIKKEKEVESSEVVTEQPNVAFIGEDPWKPLVKVTSSHKTFRLPEDQSKPFYHENAKYLIQNFPHLYKPVKAKGDK